jgi:hypothetical protein
LVRRQVPPRLGFVQHGSLRSSRASGLTVQASTRPLWQDVDRKPRPVVKEIHIYENAGGRSGIDQQAWTGAVPRAR